MDANETIVSTILLSAPVMLFVFNQCWFAKYNEYCELMDNIGLSEADLGDTEFLEPTAVPDESEEEEEDGEELEYGLIALEN